jgi:hypothetical protein
VAPNPTAQDYTLLYIDAPFEEQVQVMVYDLQGRMLNHRGFTLQAGKNTMRLPLEALSPGTYMVRVQGKATQTVKLTKR